MLSQGLVSGGRGCVGVGVLGSPPPAGRPHPRGGIKEGREGRVVAPGLTVSPGGKEGAAGAEGQVQGLRGRATAEHSLGHSLQKTRSRSRVPSPASPGAGTGVSSADLAASPPR